jgi:hypothetical protein
VSTSNYVFDEMSGSKWVIKEKETRENKRSKKVKQTLKQRRKDKNIKSRIIFN